MIGDHSEVWSAPITSAEGAGIGQRVALRKGAINFMGVGSGIVVCGVVAAFLGSHPILVGVLAGPVIGGIAAWPLARASGERLRSSLMKEAEGARQAERERQMAEAKASGALDRFRTAAD